MIDRFLISRVSHAHSRRFVRQRESSLATKLVQQLSKVCSLPSGRELADPACLTRVLRVRLSVPGTVRAASLQALSHSSEAAVLSLPTRRRHTRGGVSPQTDRRVIDETVGGGRRWRGKDIDAVMEAQRDLVAITSRHTLRQIVCVKG